MIISKTPYRISFFGGGSDYPEWYLKYGGSVISTTINKYIYVSCRHLPPFFAHKHRIVYSKIETVNKISEIQLKPVKKLKREDMSRPKVSREEKIPRSVYCFAVIGL